MAQHFSIHQFHYNVTYGDAITQHMFFLQQALKKVGVGGEIFAKEIKHFEKGEVKRFHLDQAWNCDLMLIHHSLGNPILPELLRVEIPKALIYHNITPPEFFKHDLHTRDLCLQGRHQLEVLKNHCIASFADSRYNARELESLGFKSPQVLPLFNLDFQKVNVGHEIHKLSPSQPVHLLFVGRISPHKNQKLLIEAFYYLKDLLPRGSQLNLIGGGDPVYKHYLQLLIKQLGLSQSVHLRGKVTNEALKHYYEAADAFLCASLHEGFCVPLVDAMKSGIPVFYLPRAAVKETMGSSGVSLETEDPLYIAHAIHETLKDKNAVNEILDSQIKRLEEMGESQNEKRAQDLLLNLLKVLRPTPPPLSAPEISI